MTKKFAYYTRKGAQVAPLTLSESEEDLDLEFVETDGGGEPETVMVTASALTQICQAYADDDADKDEIAAFANAVFALGLEKGLLDDDAVLAASTSDEADLDPDEFEDLGESEEDAFAGMVKHLSTRGKGFKDAGVSKPARPREGMTSTGHRVKEYSTGTTYSKVLPDDEDYDEDAIAKNPTDKRGRGRPAGASNKDKSYKAWSPESREAFRTKLAATRAARAGAKEVTESEEKIEESTGSEVSYHDKDKWFADVKKMKYDISFWGHGSVDAYDMNGKRVGTWKSEHDTHNYEPEGGTLIVKSGGRGAKEVTESEEDEEAIKAIRAAFAAKRKARTASAAGADTEVSEARKRIMERRKARAAGADTEVSEARKRIMERRKARAASGGAVNESQLPKRASALRDRIKEKLALKESTATKPADHAIVADIAAIMERRKARAASGGAVNESQLPKRASALRDRIKEKLALKESTATKPADHAIVADIAAIMDSASIFSHGF